MKQNKETSVNRMSWKQKQGREHVLAAEVLGYRGQT